MNMNELTHHGTMNLATLIYTNKPLGWHFHEVHGWVYIPMRLEHPQRGPRILIGGPKF